VDNILIHSGKGFDGGATRGIVLYPPDRRAYWSDQSLSLDRTIDYLLPISRGYLQRDSSCLSRGRRCGLALCCGTYGGPFKTCYANRLTTDFPDGPAGSQLIVNDGRSLFFLDARVVSLNLYSAPSYRDGN